MSDSTDELAALRNLLAEALSPEPDDKVSAGAVELRGKFRAAQEKWFIEAADKVVQAALDVIWTADSTREG